jgi:predicted homoserine dehydrogenase-like protein
MKRHGKCGFNHQQTNNIMIITDKALRERENAGAPIKVAIAGTGEMGKGIINQITRYTPGMCIVGIYSRNPEKTETILPDLGIQDFLCVNNLTDAETAVSEGKTIICSDYRILCRLKNADIVIEATGSIEFGAELILEAFRNKKHILSFNAELDSTFGPLLLHFARKSGVRYSLCDGDQPGVTMNLYRYLKGMGFNPLLCGNIKGMQDRYRTPETQKAFASSWNMNPYMATNFADGTKISFEQSCIANATGMTIACRGMLGFQSDDHIDNLTHLYDYDKLMKSGGIVDYVVGAKPGAGVFIYATSDDPISRKYLRYGKLGDGPLYSFYVPFHLLFFDIASAVCRLIDFNDPVIVPAAGPVVDVISVAKTRLYPGDILDGIGGFKTYGLCEKHEIVMNENLLLMGISGGLTVTREVEKDTALTPDDVEFTRNRTIDGLLQQQRALFEQVKFYPV